MKPSQIAWLVSLAAFVSTALLNEKELLSPTMHHWITFVSTIATAVSAFMLQRPEAMGGEPPAYFVVKQGGVLQQTDKRGFEIHARQIAEEDMPRPLAIEQG